VWCGHVNAALFLNLWAGLLLFAAMQGWMQSN
jgi:hypothetical protein